MSIKIRNGERIGHWQIADESPLGTKIGPRKTIISLVDSYLPDTPSKVGRPWLSQQSKTEISHIHYRQEVSEKVVPLPIIKRITMRQKFANNREVLRKANDSNCV